jgi:hypothetical protein
MVDDGRATGRAIAIRLVAETILAQKAGVETWMNVGAANITLSIVHRMYPFGSGDGHGATCQRLSVAVGLGGFIV